MAGTSPANTGLFLHRLSSKHAWAVCFSVAALIFAFSLEPTQARHRHVPVSRYGCCGFSPNSDPYDTDLPPISPFPPPPAGLPPQAYPDGEPQFVPGPSPRPGPAPYPQGFVLDVPIKPDRDETARTSAPPMLNRYRDVAGALAQCWNPPAEFDDKRWEQATLRVSFKRDGSLNGVPLIPHVGGDLTAQARSGLTSSLMAALRGCAPLKFSTSLGAAVAGQIFALRFIEQDQD